ncbi:hypothetical protein [Nocardia sp. NPDC057030]|uniref:hypothetical protein n=1 Tax=unclassified Nocardia TaxID=2637762 RepID=UPI00364262B0
MIPVGRLPPGDQWDCHILDLLFANRLYPTGLEFGRHEGYPDADGTILIVPGRYWAGREAEISDAVARYDWLLLIVTSDEESTFDATRIRHPRMRCWIQTPRVDRDYGDARLIPLGFPPHFDDLPAPDGRPTEVFLAAQNTHTRRVEAFAALARDTHIQRVHGSAGFTLGLSPQEYVRQMCRARVAPAPSGAFSPDTFRLWEALEAHTIPIADDRSPVYDSRGYWQRTAPGTPFPVLADYADLPGYIGDVLADYPRRANRATAWWMARKRQMAQWVGDDLTALGARLSYTDRLPITVMVSTSPIPSHPDTAIIDETIASVRAQLPDSEIVLMHDGVRPDQQHRRADYETYIQRVLWSADHQWRNVLPLIFDDHLHQAGCTIRALEHVRTPLLLFIEGDTPLTGEIPWAAISDTIVHGDANVVRFSHEAHILDVHRYLTLDADPQTVRGVPMTRTIQWSQRPHLASVAWYRNTLDRHFRTGTTDFIEEVFHGRLIEAHRRDGDMGWLTWRTWLYTPPGDIKRSYHLDGRNHGRTRE